MTQTNAANGNATDDENRTTRLVNHVLESAEEGDSLVFNGREDALTVSGAYTGDSIQHVTVKDNTGDVFRFLLSNRSGASFQKATGEHTKHGTREWEEYDLESVEIISTHRFEFGNIYERVLEDENLSHSRLFSIVTGDTTKHGDPVVVSLHIRKGEVISAERDSLSKTYHKPKIMDANNSEFQQVGSLSKHYIDHSVDDNAEITDFGTQDDMTPGVRFTYDAGGSTYLPYTLFIPNTETRFEPVN